MSLKVGVPLQIISDHGGDIKKGIELFVQKSPEIIGTTDVTHYMALLFQKELETDEKYQSFLRHCSQTRLQIQQTKLNLLIPPQKRAKSRYLNVQELVKWAERTLNYQNQGYFSNITPVFRLETSAYSQLKGEIENKTYKKLKTLVGQTYFSPEDFSKALNTRFNTQLHESQIKIILKAANIGQQWFEQKLGWLKDYQEDIPIYSKMVDIVHQVEKQLSHQGLNQCSQAIFLEEIKQQVLTPRLEKVKTKIKEYLASEGDKIPVNETLWSNSNVLESIFGKFKLFMETSPSSEINKLVLMIPLCTINITGEFIKNAMESVSIKDVENWANGVFGQSTLSKKRALLNPLETTQKLHEKH